MSESGKNIYEVQIAGLQLKLRSSHDPETVNELVEFVDHKIKEAMSSQSQISFQNALLLASLNITEDFLLLKKVAGAELSNLEARAERILDQIEDSRQDLRPEL